ncbi:MAG: M23 family metallopeptidase [Thermodesulfobacteriota bacterium]|nr:M23 family metallopeptidase [Thermodesulfobacteriota bacterium]
MRKRKKINFFLTFGLLLGVLVFLAWFLAGIFEGEKPRITLEPLPAFLSESQNFALSTADMKKGLKILKVSVSQEGRKIAILEKTFPYVGLFNRGGFHAYHTEFSIDPSELNLAQGRADLEVRVWDYSRRSGGDGNLSLVGHKMIVDTIPPAIRSISRMHYFNMGGTGLVVYQTSSDSVESGIFVDDVFCPGFPATKGPQEGLHVCYFAIPHNTKARPDLFLWAKDKAGNRSRANFDYHIRRKRFRTDRINITDRFLKRILPSFSPYIDDSDASPITKFLKINRDLRRKNSSDFYEMRTKTDPNQLWNGTWLRLKNAATMARFGDHRSYYHKGKAVDNQVHVGVDLASLANSEVQAANHGCVIFSGYLGIYGLTVVLDHGQGLASVYSHLSEIKVDRGQKVTKGEAIGVTGQTGLAGGDHLHFGVLVSGVFANPIEWWDPHWIRDNITRKLALLDGS